ncbi:MAG: alanine dehydrogenase [Methanosarcinales archaeon]|nr:alanine dehydrogenase [ANME-2 cluster archaeon]MDW7775810.1 alanine dehydrogenase [Methanosarcinales archaeon]
MKVNILWLTKREVEELVNIYDVIPAVEVAFREHGLDRVQMPPKMYLNFKAHNGDLRAMPGYLEGPDIAGVKLVNVHPDNPARGLPTVMALMVLNSTETGAPLAVMDGTTLTDLRTGAAGGVAAKYLSRKDSKIVGMIGLGRQARTQLQALTAVRDIELVRIFDTSMNSMEAFKTDMELKTGIDIITCADTSQACNCDILVTTTPVTSPLVKAEWIKAGTHINAIGADAAGKEELDPMILKKAKVVVDAVAQASHSGEVNVPISKGIFSVEEIYAELGQVVSGKKPGRESDAEITVFDSTGLAIQDVVTADLIYRRAIERKAGTELEMF